MFCSILLSTETISLIDAVSDKLRTLLKVFTESLLIVLLILKNSICLLNLLTSVAFSSVMCFKAKSTTVRDGFIILASLKSLSKDSFEVDSVSSGLVTTFGI